MRLTKLELRAYGPFANVTLDLGRSDGDEPGLTIVYGPNESGKSTALRAVRQFFFGIDGESDDQRFSKKELRIGGTLRDDAGTERGAFRRGTRKEALYDADDRKSLPADDPSIRMLKRLDASTYRIAYGLDHEELKSGAEAIAASEGKLDDVLLAATTKLKKLQEFRRSLTVRAEELFLPSANAKRTINELIRKVKDLDDQATRAKQPIEAFHRLRDDLIRVEGELASLAKSRSALNERIALLQRFQDLFGDCVAREGVERTLAELADVPLLEGDLDARFEVLRTAATRAKAESVGAAAEYAAAGKEILELPASSPLSAHAERIESLDERALLLENERREVDELSRGRAAIARAADEVLATIGESATRTELDSLALPKTFAASVRKLVADRLALRVKDGEDRKRLAEMEASLATIEIAQGDEDLDLLAETIDERIRAASEAFDSAMPAREKAEESVRSNVDALRRWIAERFEDSLAWERLPYVQVPTFDTIEAQSDRLRRSEGRSETLAASRRDAEAKLRELNRLIDAAVADKLPSAEDLREARRRRDATLSRLATVVDRNSEESGVDGESLRATTFATLAGEVSEADRIADVLSNEAGRCEKLRRDRLDAASLVQELEAIDRDRREIEAERAEGERKWEALWRAIGARSGPPKEMQAWRREWERRARQVEETLVAMGERDRLATTIDAAFASLREILQKAEEAPDAASASSYGAALAAAHRVKKRLSERLDRLADDRRDRSALSKDILARKDAIRSNAVVHAAWEEEWDRLTRKLPAGARTEPDETPTFLDQFADWRELRQQERSIDEAIGSLAAKMDAFANEVAALASDVGESPPADGFAQVRRWKAALALAKQRDVEAERLRARFEKRQEETERAERELRRATSDLTDFCQSIGAADPDDIGKRLQAIREKREALRTLAVLEGRKTRSLPGWSWEKLSSELAKWSPEALDAESKSLRDQVLRLEGEEKELFAELRELQRSKETWDGRANAAEIEQLKQRQLVEIADSSERYAIYCLAGAALQESIDRYREKHKSPILDRAGKFFEKLTLWRFSGLEPHDVPQGGGIAIAGIRSSENDGPREVPVAAMSRGTCDQLYLAFRMALWEERLEKGPPIPIVLDDVLVHFDDDRAAATLQAFDELAKRTQIVYFTHHRHLVDLARRVLPPERLLIRELSPPGS